MTELTGWAWIVWCMAFPGYFCSPLWCRVLQWEVMQVLCGVSGVDKFKVEGLGCLHSTLRSGLVNINISSTLSKISLAAHFQLSCVYINVFVSDSIQKASWIYDVLQIRTCFLFSFSLFPPDMFILPKFWWWNGKRCAYFSRLLRGNVNTIFHGKSACSSSNAAQAPYLISLPVIGDDFKSGDYVLSCLLELQPRKGKWNEAFGFNWVFSDYFFWWWW